MDCHVVQVTATMPISVFVAVQAPDRGQALARAERFSATGEFEARLLAAARRSCIAEDYAFEVADVDPAEADLFLEGDL